jgi:hypothetical protein
LFDVAFVRAIAEMLGTVESVRVESFQKWRRVLGLAFEKQRQTIVAELMGIIERFGLEFTADDVARYCRTQCINREISVLERQRVVAELMGIIERFGLEFAADDATVGWKAW